MLLADSHSSLRQRCWMKSSAATSGLKPRLVRPDGTLSCSPCRQTQISPPLKVACKCSYISCTIAGTSAPVHHRSNDSWMSWFGLGEETKKPQNEETKKPQSEETEKRPSRKVPPPTYTSEELKNAEARFYGIQAREERMKHGIINSVLKDACDEVTGYRHHGHHHHNNEGHHANGQEAALHSYGHHKDGHVGGDLHGHHKEAHAGEHKQHHSHDHHSHGHHKEGHTHTGHHHHHHAQEHQPWETVSHHSHDVAAFHKAVDDSFKPSNHSSAKSGTHRHEGDHFDRM